MKYIPKEHTNFLCFFSLYIFLSRTEEEREPYRVWIIQNILQDWDGTLTSAESGEKWGEKKGGKKMLWIGQEKSENFWVDDDDSLLSRIAKRRRRRAAHDVFSLLRQPPPHSLCGMALYGGVSCRLSFKPWWKRFLFFHRSSRRRVVVHRERTEKFQIFLFSCCLLLHLAHTFSHERGSPTTPKKTKL